MKLYVYCLAEGIDELEKPLHGISGAPVRVLKAEELSVLVSDLDADSAPVTRENALAHAAVVRSILDRTTPLPFRYGTIVSEPQLQSYLSARKAAIQSKLASVRGCVEMSVKIIWDNIEPEQHESNQNPAQGPGANFLAAKRLAILGDESNASRASEVSRWVHEQVRDFVRDELVTLRPKEKMVLSAAHLIERGRMAEYRQKLAEMRQSRPEFHFLFSGPWPPYSFANIDLEFKTQFGVS